MGAGEVVAPLEDGADVIGPDEGEVVIDVGTPITLVPWRPIPTGDVPAVKVEPSTTTPPVPTETATVCPSPFPMTIPPLASPVIESTKEDTLSGSKGSNCLRPCSGAAVTTAYWVRT